MPRCDVRAVKKKLEKAAFEKRDPEYDDGRIIKEEGQLGLKAESRCSTRKHLAPYGLEKVEIQHEGCRLGAAGVLYMSLTEYKQDPVTSSPLSIDTLGDQRNLPVENRFEDTLKRERTEVTEG